MDLSELTWLEGAPFVGPADESNLGTPAVCPDTPIHQEELQVRFLWENLLISEVFFF